MDPGDHEYTGLAGKVLSESLYYYETVLIQQKLRDNIICKQKTRAGQAEAISHGSQPSFFSKNLHFLLKRREGVFAKTSLELLKGRPLAQTEPHHPKFSLGGPLIDGLPLALFPG